MGLHIEYEPDEDGWVLARIEEIPEVITCAPTQAEAREMIRDALSERLKALTTGVTGWHASERETLTLSVVSFGGLGTPSWQWLLRCQGI